MREDSMEIGRDFLESQLVLFMAGRTVCAVQATPILLFVGESDWRPQATEIEDDQRYDSRSNHTPD
jgi:hypothetical protein